MQMNKILQEYNPEINYEKTDKQMICVLIH